MSYYRTFKTPVDKNNSSDRISKLKAKTIYNECVDRANAGGIYHKNSRPDGSGKYMGTYRGNVYISSENKCLVGADSYDTLLSVSKGHYLSTPPQANLEMNTGDLWYGQFAITKYNNIDPSQSPVVVPYQGADASKSNKITYDCNDISSCPLVDYDNPDINANFVIDPSYNIFYSSKDDIGPTNSCYIRNEYAYFQYVDISGNSNLAHNYQRFNELQGFRYPAKFQFNCINAEAPPWNYDKFIAISDGEPEPEPEPEPELEEDPELVDANTNELLSEPAEAEPEPEPEPAEADAPDETDEADTVAAAEKERIRLEEEAATAAAEKERIRLEEEAATAAAEKERIRLEEEATAAAAEKERIRLEEEATAAAAEKERIRLEEEAASAAAEKERIRLEEEAAAAAAEIERIRLEEEARIQAAAAAAETERLRLEEEARLQAEAAAATEPENAITVINLNKDSCTDISTSDLVGWEFTTNNDITITDIGFLTDHNTSELQNSHQIRIYEKGTETLLIEETISNDDTYENQTKYKKLGSPVLLTQGSYIILAYRENNNKNLVYTMLNEDGKEEIIFNEAITFVSNIAENSETFKYTDNIYPSFGIAFIGATFKFIESPK
jgi:hypothetical protein